MPFNPRSFPTLVATLLLTCDVSAAALAADGVAPPGVPKVEASAALAGSDVPGIDEGAAVLDRLRVIQEILGADPGADALEEGDLVVEVNRKPTPDVVSYRRVVGGFRPGELAWLYVFRPRERRVFLTRIEVEKRP